jgi:hypothetical protein
VEVAERNHAKPVPLGAVDLELKDGIGKELARNGERAGKEIIN